MICAMFAACGAAPEFIPMDAESVTVVNWVSAGNRKDIDSEEYYSGIAEAYNSVTETDEYEDGSEIWSIIVVCQKDGENENDVSLYHISYIGTDTFDVSVSGAATPEGKDVRYSVVNEKLAEYASANMLTIQSTYTRVKVRFSVDDGIVEEDGTVNEGERVLSESEQTLAGNEFDLPTLSEAVVQALMVENFTDDYDVAFDDLRINAIAGYENITDTEGESARIYRWELFLNGEKVLISEAKNTVVNEGDEIAVRYCDEAALNAELSDD